MAEEIRFIPTSLDLVFEEVYDSNKAKFQEEYNSLSEYENSDIEDWLKKAKAKGLLEDSDKVLVALLVELHKKVDRLEDILKQKEKNLVELQLSSKIIGINFDYIKSDGLDFLSGYSYYARVTMPTFPKREIPLFLNGVEKNIAKISLISQKNLEDWNSFVMQKEREMIRELKRSK